MSPATKKTKPSSTLQFDIENFLKSNEKGDAELFAQMFNGEVAYDHFTKNWYLWRGQYYEEDARREIIGYVSNRVAAEYIQQAAKERVNGETELYKMLIERGKHLRALTRTKHVLEYAASEPGIGLSGAEWDNNVDLLPVNNGVIDLKTAKFRNASPTEYLRHHSPVDWMDINCLCLQWENILLTIFDGDAEMVAYFQRVLGYAITGRTTEKILPILIGREASNGKTTIFETLNKVLGSDLCMSIPVKVLMKKKIDFGGNAPEPYLVKLRGKRLVYASETEKGLRLDMELVKKLSGMDAIHTRDLHEKAREFIPTHTLMLFANDEPIIPPDDQGAWDRIAKIDLKIRFVDNPTKPNERKKDKDIGEKLKSEYSGILAWLVRGCLDWQKQGLNPPKQVTEWTALYRASEDTLTDFINDACVVHPNSKIKVMQAWGKYQNWTNTYHVPVMNLREFKNQMEIKFGPPQKENTGWYYHGIQ